MPSVSRDDPAFADNTYWRGRIWPPLNFIVWHGLRRNGLDEQASRLAAESYALFRASWEGARLCPENYNADTGEALDQPDTEGFYGWGVLMPMLGLAAITDVNPWSGWEIVNEGGDVRVGPLQTPAGLVVIEREAGSVTISHGDRMLLYGRTCRGGSPISGLRTASHRSRCRPPFLPDARSCCQPPPVARLPWLALVLSI